MKSHLLLNHISNFINLTPKEEELLISKVGFRKYLKGQYVVQEGDISMYQNFVLAGSLRSFYLDSKGNEHIVAFAIENWWTGDLGSFIAQEPANYNVQCLENSELAQLSYHNIESLYDEIPKLERFFRILVQKAYVVSQKRIVKNLSLTAKERYLNFRNQYPEFDQRVPQYMIASYLGVTPEFLSRIRKEVIQMNAKS